MLVGQSTTVVQTEASQELLGEMKFGTFVHSCSPQANPQDGL